MCYLDKQCDFFIIFVPNSVCHINIALYPVVVRMAIVLVSSQCLKCFAFPFSHVTKVTKLKYKCLESHTVFQGSKRHTGTRD